jgi:hypothetical protein
MAGQREAIFAGCSGHLRFKAEKMTRRRSVRTILIIANRQDAL